MPEPLQQRLVRCFLAADTDGSGHVGRRELYTALEQAGIDVMSADAVRMFQEADVRDTS